MRCGASADVADEAMIERPVRRDRDRHNGLSSGGRLLIVSSDARSSRTPAAHRYGGGDGHSVHPDPIMAKPEVHVGRAAWA